MKNKDKELSEEESLKIIEGMIGLAKEKINNSGFHFILWGILVILASISQYVMIEQGVVKNSFWGWIISVGIGVPIAIVYEMRRKNKTTTRTKFDHIYGYLWMGFGITLFVVIYVSVLNRISPTGPILALVGLATFLSGIIQKFTPLIIGAVLFWAAACICPELDMKNQLLLNAVTIFIGYIIPGILLSRKSKMN